MYVVLETGCTQPALSYGTELTTSPDGNTHIPSTIDSAGAFYNTVPSGGGPEKAGAAFHAPSQEAAHPRALQSEKGTVRERPYRV